MVGPSIKWPEGSLAIPQFCAQTENELTPDLYWPMHVYFYIKVLFFNRLDDSRPVSTPNCRASWLGLGLVRSGLGLDRNDSGTWAEIAGTRPTIFTHDCKTPMCEKRLCWNYHYVCIRKISLLHATYSALVSVQYEQWALATSIVELSQMYWPARYIDWYSVTLLHIA